MLRLIVSGLVGTCLMTTFSYWRAYKEKDQFEEPIMLGKLIRRAGWNTMSPLESRMSGWILHYLIGYLFLVCYKQIWNRTNAKPGFSSGLLMGVPSGLVGIAFWYMALKFHPRAPQTDLKKYLQQLFFAHLIFGASAATTYKILIRSTECKVR